MSSLPSPCSKSETAPRGRHHHDHVHRSGASSELLATVGADGYAAMFSAHTATLRSVIVARGGRVAKLLGDGVEALFDSAYAGVMAAVDAQQAVELVNRRGANAVLGMRIGI